VTSCPQLVNLMLHFKSVMPPMESNVDAAQRLLDDVPVTFLIVDDLDFSHSSRRYLGPVITAYGDRWKKVFTAPSAATTIYQRTRALPPRAACRPARCPPASSILAQGDLTAWLGM
jgi:hypothetical protein